MDRFRELGGLLKGMLRGLLRGIELLRLKYYEEIVFKCNNV